MVLSIKHSFLLVFFCWVWSLNKQASLWVLHMSRVLLFLTFPFPSSDSLNTTHQVETWRAFLLFHMQPLWFWISYVYCLGLDALLVVSLNTTAHDEFSSFEFGKGFDYMTHLTIGMRELGKMLSQYLVSCGEEMQLFQRPSEWNWNFDEYFWRPRCLPH